MPSRGDASMNDYIQTMTRSRAWWVPWIWIFAMLGWMGPRVTLAQANAPRDAIEVTQDRMEQSVAPEARFLRDPDGTLDLRAVMARFEAGAMDAAPEDLGFGFSSDAIWLRFAIRNASDRRVDLVLDSSYPLIDDLAFYELDEEGQLRNTQEMGDSLAFHQRSLWISSFAYELSLEPRVARVIYVRARSTSSLSLPVKLYSRGVFTEYLHQHMLVVGIFYGIVLGLMVYNLFLYVPTRDLSYLDYSAMALANLCFVASVDGVNYMLMPDFVAWQQIATYVFICLFSIFGVRFSRGFFNSGETCPRFHRCMVGLGYLFCGYLVALLFTQSSKLFGAILISGMASIASVVVLAVLRLRQGYGPAKIYLLAWSVTVFSVIYSILAAMKVIGSYSATPYLQKAGIAVEMVVLSIALANRIKTLKSAESAALEVAHVAKVQSKAKSDFLAKMSHEIRTPMNGVLGMAEILKGSALNPSQANCVRTIQTSGEALLGVINDILDYSKIEAGKMSVESRALDLERLLDDLELMFDARAREKGLPLIVSLDPEVPLTILGDETRLRQVLVNLLGNAFKFTAKGSVELRVGFGDDLREGFRFEVIDTGIGIGQAAQARLFESFSQEDASVTRQYGGTGLGLTICDQLVTLMGGSLGVQSQKGEGSTFYFTLPQYAAPEARNTKETLDAQWARRGERVVHFVARPSVNARHTQHLIEQWGLSLRGHEPDDFVRFTQEEVQGDLVVLHESLEDEELKACLERCADRKVLLLRGPQQKQLLGADESNNREILVQPSGRARLRKTMIRVIESEGRARSTSIAHAGPKDEESYAHLKVLVADDNLVNQAVVKGMLRRFGVTPTVVSNGKEAVEAFDHDCDPFDLVLMDCEMPEMDGYQATREIRQRCEGQCCSVFIFALTAHALAEHKEQALEAGMDDHLTKPVSMEALRGALAKVQRLGRRDAA